MYHPFIYKWVCLYEPFLAHSISKIHLLIYAILYHQMLTTEDLWSLYLHLYLKQIWFLSSCWFLSLVYGQSLRSVLQCLNSDRCLGNRQNKIHNFTEKRDELLCNKCLKTLCKMSQGKVYFAFLSELNHSHLLQNNWFQFN